MKACKKQFLVIHDSNTTFNSKNLVDLTSEKFVSELKKIKNLIKKM